MKPHIGIALVCLWASPLAATPKVSATLVAGLRGGVPSDRALNVKLGQEVTLWVVVTLRERGRRRVYSDATRLKLRGRLLSGRRLRPLAELSARFVWQRVEPHPHHVDLAPPNRGNPAYSNATLFGPRHGKWIGYDTIEYKASVIAGASSSSLTVDRTRPTHPRVDINDGLGTMRYAVTVALPDGRRASSPGVDATTPRGISSHVMRVTFRSDDHWVGFLRGYFNVPNVFGSGGHGKRHQTELYQGADCADVITGALREAGARVPYTSARGLVRYARPITGRLLLDERGIFDASGRTGVELSYGRDIKRGDIMLIDYANFKGSPRSWDHVAVIDGDRGKRGVFDPKDIILHMGYLYGLTEEPAHGEGPAYVQILRLKKHVQRQLKRAQKRRARRERRRRGG